MEEKKGQYKAVRKFMQGKDSHMQKCMLFWNLLAWYLYALPLLQIRYFPRPAYNQNC